MKKVCKDLLTPVGLLQKYTGSKKEENMSYRNLEVSGCFLLLCRESRYFAYITFSDANFTYVK